MKERIFHLLSWGFLIPDARAREMSEDFAWTHVVGISEAEVATHLERLAFGVPA
jgi:hypothetical protein